MAITKIFPIRGRLDQRIGYIMNPHKTAVALSECVDYIIDPGKTQELLYVSSFGCDADTAFETMWETKKRFGKENRKVHGYHMIQSFPHGEVTPELAHEIGRELVSRFLDCKYEAVVTTHTDKEHVHCHVVFNSVSCIDGSMYRNKLKYYYEGIRKISDDICREHGLSVVQPKDRAKQYAEWKAENEGKPTKAGIIKKDVDGIIQRSFTYKAFLENLKRAGYEVKITNKNISVRPPNSARFRRLDYFGSDYTEEAIRERIKSGQTAKRRQPSKTTAANKSYRLRGPYLTKKKIRGFEAIYFRYLYMFGKIKKNKAPPRLTRRMTDEAKKLDMYTAQFRLIHDNKITTTGELAVYCDRLIEWIDGLTEERYPLYAERRDAGEYAQEEISQEIKAINSKLRKYRTDLRLCRNIAESIPAMQEYLKLAKTLEEQEKEAKANEHVRRYR